MVGPDHVVGHLGAGLPDPDLRGRDKLIRRYWQVGARRPAANTPREVKPRRVAGAEPALVRRRGVAPGGLQPASKMRAEADDNQPLFMTGLRPVGVTCGCI